MRFQNGLTVFPTNAADNKKSIYATTTDGRLAQLWDADRWFLDFPLEYNYLALVPTNNLDSHENSVDNRLETTEAVEIISRGGGVFCSLQPDSRSVASQQEKKDEDTADMSANRDYSPS